MKSGLLPFPLAALSILASMSADAAALPHCPSALSGAAVYDANTGVKAYSAVGQGTDNAGFISFIIYGGNEFHFAIAESLAAWGVQVGYAARTDSVGKPGYLSWPQLRHIRDLGHEFIEWYFDAESDWMNWPDDASGGETGESLSTHKRFVASDETYLINEPSWKSCSEIADSISSHKEFLSSEGFYPEMLLIHPDPEYENAVLFCEPLHCALVQTYDLAIVNPIGIEGGCNYSPTPGERICVYGTARGADLQGHVIDPHNIMCNRGCVWSLTQLKTYMARFQARGHWWNLAFRHNLEPGGKRFDDLREFVVWARGAGVSILSPSDAARFCYYERQPPRGNLVFNSSMTTDIDGDDKPDGCWEKLVTGGRICDGDGPEGSVCYWRMRTPGIGRYDFVVTGAKPGYKYQVSWWERSHYSQTSGGRFGPMLYYQKYYPNMVDYYEIGSDSLLFVHHASETNGVWIEASSAREGASDNFAFVCPDSTVTIGIDYRQPLLYYGGPDSLDVTLFRIVEIADPEALCTFNMNDWGSPCPDSHAGDSLSVLPGCIRDHYFLHAFPEGWVRVGDQAGPDGAPFFTAAWSSAGSVEAFLPAEKKPRVLRSDCVDPVRTHAGSLTGEALALRLNVEFSCAGIFERVGLTSSPACYAAFTVPCFCDASKNSVFEGMTVQRFLALADSAVGGISGIEGSHEFTLSEITSTASCLNQAFAGCGTSGSSSLQTLFLPTREAEEGIQAEEVRGDTPARFAVTQSFPNPSNPCATIVVALPREGRVTVEIYDIAGRHLTTLLSDHRDAGYHSVPWPGSDERGRPVASGVYFCRVRFGDEADVKKMIVLR
jgi:hypothetical protein